MRVAAGEAVYASEVESGQFVRSSWGMSGPVLAKPGASCRGASIFAKVIWQTGTWA